MTVRRTPDPLRFFQGFFSGRIGFTSIQEKVNVVAASGSSQTLDASKFGVHDITLSLNCTFTPAGAPPAGIAGSMVLYLRQGGTIRTATWNSAIKWDGGYTPLINQANSLHVFGFMTVDGGTTWQAVHMGSSFS